MADYKLDCCGGFPGHKLHCHAIERSRYDEFVEEQRRDYEKRSFETYLSELTEEELFKFLERAMSKSLEWQSKYRMTLDFMPINQRMRYLEWRRNR